MKIKPVLIIGGGLAGLTAAIHLSKNGIPVTLFEKEDFPHHKVCGEYVSREILPYFHQLELPIDEIKPVAISRLHFSNNSGKSVRIKLPLGGLGISRYAFDNFLYQQALKAGVEVRKANVTAVEFSAGIFEIETKEKEKFKAKLVLGAYGKRSNLDKNLNRSFFKETSSWLAIKSHYENKNFPDDLVGLHNFKGGYCGLSKTESGAVNVCYLATYKSFKEQKNQEDYIENVLRKNPFLNDFFSRSFPLFSSPISIAQVSFLEKSVVEDHVLMLGDSAGLLHPLCGNGMAMAIHSAKIASELILENFKDSYFNREKLEKAYEKSWKSNFQKRLTTGKWLQKILLNENLTEISLQLLSVTPGLFRQIVKQTHGKPIV